MIIKELSAEIDVRYNTLNISSLLSHNSEYIITMDENTII